LDGAVALHEVKGWNDERSQEAMRCMALCHPGITVVVIDARTYRALARRCKDAIAGWE
jgi:hypothetical protein